MDSDSQNWQAHRESSTESNTRDQIERSCETATFLFPILKV